MHRLGTTVAIAATACAVSGCGGHDERDVQQVVRDFATAVNTRDGKTFCTKLTTRSYLERVTAAKGPTAVKQCETQINALRLQEKYKVVSFQKTKVDGDDATVTAVLLSEGQRRPQVFRLHREDGRFRLTSGATN